MRDLSLMHEAAQQPDPDGRLADLAAELMAPPAPAQPVVTEPPAWRAALDRAIALDPRGKLGVAERLGVSRPYVSRVTTGDIPVAPQRFIDRVVDVYMGVECPHLQATLPPGQCRDYAARQYAQISREEVPHWRACRRCPLNPHRTAPATAR